MNRINSDPEFVMIDNNDVELDSFEVIEHIEELTVVNPYNMDVSGDINTKNRGPGVRNFMARRASALKTAALVAKTGILRPAAAVAKTALKPAVKAAKTAAHAALAGVLAKVEEAANTEARTEAPAGPLG